MPDKCEIRAVVGDVAERHEEGESGKAQTQDDLGKAHGHGEIFSPSIRLKIIETRLRREQCALRYAIGVSN
jgi:hypothetical protein